MADAAADVTKATGLLSSLEKASEVQTFVTLFTFMLVVDCGLIHSRGHGIAALVRNEALLKPDLALVVVVVFVVFSLLMSIVRPIVGAVVLSFTMELAFGTQGLLRGVKEALFRSTRGAPEEISRSYRNRLASGSVPTVQLRQKAHATTDRYFLDLLREAEAKEGADDERERQLTLAATSLVLIAGYNWFAFAGASSPAFLRQAAAFMGDGGATALFIGHSLFFWAFVILPMFNDPLRWTYCPPLARELASEFDARKEAERKLLARAKARIDDVRSGEHSPPSSALFDGGVD